MAEFTPEQQRILDDEEFIREIISKRYFSSAPSAKDSGKPAWQRFLESTGGAALITVVLGGVFGNIIAQSIQSWNKQRETHLVAFQEYTKGEQQTVKDAFQMIGKSMSASENLSTLTEAEFDLNRFEGKEKEAVRHQREELKSQYNKVDEDWRSSRETIALMMAYYHHSKPEVTQAWTGVQDGLTTYMDCEKRWYLEHDGAGLDMKTVQNACSGENGTLHSALQKLTASLESARVYEWELSKQK